MRRPATDNSTAVSLFPFLAVLLCTMGALLVVLVAVSRLARDQAERRAEVAQSQAESAEDAAAADEARRELERIDHYQAQLEQARAEAERQLREDQLRLSHIEEHMRRLVDQLDALRMAAAELSALEEEHYDDHEQAQREVERLHQLIADTREMIESLKEESRGKRKSYAIVPYEGPSGTRRRPLYIECRRDSVLLQPEGIELTPGDFLPPLGPGNPLASALRAAREHFMREGYADPTSRDNEPYPLILVRPDGILAYYRVRDAISSWDSDFGYELIEGDWEIEYPPANPHLAMVEHQAVEQARARQKLLAAAAPRAYRARQSGAGGSFELEGMGDEDGSFGGGWGRSLGDGDGSFAGGMEGEPGGTSGLAPPSGGGAEQNSVSTLAGPSGGQDARGDESSSGSEHGDSAGHLTGTAGASAAGQAASGGADGAPYQPTQSTSGEPGGQADAAVGGPGGASGMAASPANTASGASLHPTSASPNAEESPSMASLDFNMNQQQPENAERRAKNWAVPSKTPGAVPIRRTIQVVVRGDRLAILPEAATTDGPVADSKEIPLSGRTDTAVDEFVTAIGRHVEDWGIAGRGLYWRPVIVVNVAPDGRQRAEDLYRLLDDSGLELRPAATAERQEGTSSRATR